MAIDFPASPTNGQTFTQGGMSWTWDGVKWNSLSSGFVDAPSDGVTYGRKNAAWSSVDAMLAPAVSAGANNAGRNLIHNGQFNIAQRGAGPFNVNGAYTLDRWAQSFNLDTSSISQTVLGDAGRTAIGDESAQFILQNTFVGNAGAAAYNLVQHGIENVYRLANKTVTASFWAASATGAPKLGVSIDQAFGTGGSPSAQVNGAGQSVTLSSTWTRYSLTFTLASVVGKTIGSNGNNATWLNFWYSSGTTQATRAGSIGVQSGTVYVWGIQLEVGTQATSLAKRDPADDLALCQRFFQTGMVPYIQGYTSGSQNVGYGLLFVTPMRAAPTMAATWNNTNITSPNVGPNSSMAWQIWGTTSAAGNYLFSASNVTASADL